MQDWSPISWQDYNQEQSIDYPDRLLLSQVIGELSQLPPLVTRHEINYLKKAIAAAGRGDSFLLQGGDCAESFKDCHAEIIINKLRILEEMSFILDKGMKKPIVRIGRIAGQYTKPRSSNFETIAGRALPSYRGDMVNSKHFTVEARTPNPRRILQAYHHAAMTLNFIRAFLSEWHTDLAWSPEALRYHRKEFFTSHEALHLYYEQALTRRSWDNRWYNLSTHLPWIGMRTATPSSAHVEFLRGIENPVGIKIGPTIATEWLKEIITLLNPQKEEGRILLITRLGEKNTKYLLPPLIEIVQKNRFPVTWACDPMHGNTELTADGIKTRCFNTILSELKQTMKIHHDMSNHLGGVHFELTGDNVTECLGGSRGLTQNDLKKAYHSLVDPRLNYEQSIEMAIELTKV